MIKRDFILGVSAVVVWPFTPHAEAADLLRVGAHRAFDQATRFWPVV